MIIVLAKFIHQGKLAPLILRHTQYFWRYMIRIVFKYQFLLRCPSWATYNPFLEHQHVMYTCTSANSIFVGTELSAYCKHGATLSHSIISIQLHLNDMHFIAQSIADVSFLWHGPFVCPSKRNWTRTRAVLDIPILSHSFTLYSYLCKDHPNSFFSSLLHFTPSFQPTLRSHFLFTLHHLTLHSSYLCNVSPRLYFGHLPWKLLCPANAFTNLSIRFLLHLSHTLKSYSYRTTFTHMIPRLHRIVTFWSYDVMCAYSVRMPNALSFTNNSNLSLVHETSNISFSRSPQVTWTSCSIVTKDTFSSSPNISPSFSLKHHVIVIFPKIIITDIFMTSPRDLSACFVIFFRCPSLNAL